MAAEIPEDPARYILDIFAGFAPEPINAMGLPGHETEIVDLSPGVDERVDTETTAAIATLERGRAAASDPRTKQDFELVSKAAHDSLEEQRLERRFFVRHGNVGKTIFLGLRANLAPSANPEHALARLQKYTASPSIFARARARTEVSRKDPSRLAPTKTELEDELRDLDVYFTTLPKLFAASKVRGYEAPLASLVAESKAYASWIREKLLPIARTDYRLPLEVYDFRLRKNGVTSPRAILAADARAAYAATTREMIGLAKDVAKDRKIKDGTLLGVVATWKKDAKTGDALIALYEKRLVDLEAIVVKERLVTLPKAPLHVRLATEAETADNPAPTIDVQALFKKGTPIDMIVPQAALASKDTPQAALAYTDFTFDAASWAIAAHEGRPGHELQFSSLKERGLSLARTLFAFNAVNVEGWGLYSERIVYPFLPKEGKLALLRMRALREARAFLDPGLHDGTVTLEDARHVIAGELGFSDAVTKQELDRYTYKSPAQAPAYFYGYTQVVALREACEKLPGFTPLKFHDAVIDAGLLPPSLLAPIVKDALAKP